MKSEGVKAIVLSVSPKQTASAVGVAAAQGLNVPFLGSNSSYAPQLLDTPVGPALVKNFVVMQATSPLSADLDVMKKLATDYKAEYPDASLDNGVMAGYATAAITGDALKLACEKKDLTRDGIISAHRSQNAWDGGFGSKMDFTDVSQPPSRDTNILQPDKDSLGGLKTIQEASASENAKKYEIKVG